MKCEHKIYHSWCDYCNKKKKTTLKSFLESEDFDNNYTEPLKFILVISLLITLPIWLIPYLYSKFK